MSTTIATKGQAAPAVQVTDDTVKRFADLLMSGKSQVALDVAAHKGTQAEQDGNVAGIIAAAKVLRGREESAVIGQAVACYVLTRKTDKVNAYRTGTQLAEELGLSKGRVSQLANEGAVYVNLGLPEGWTGTKVTRQQVRNIVSGAGSKDVRTIAAGRQAESTRRKAIAALVEKAESKAAADKATAAAQRENSKAIREASRGTAPTDGQAEETAPKPLTADQIGTAVSQFEDLAAVLLSHDVTPAQARVLSGIVAQLAAKFPASK